MVLIGSPRGDLLFCLNSIFLGILQLTHLGVVYGDRVLFDGEVDELVWSDSPGGVKIEGRIKGKSAGGGAKGLLDLVTGLSKTATAKVAEEKREEYEGEVVE